jgi:hypothetical protein
VSKEGASHLDVGRRYYGEVTVGTTSTFRPLKRIWHMWLFRLAAVEFLVHLHNVDSLSAINRLGRCCSRLSGEI